MKGGNWQYTWRKTRYLWVRRNVDGHRKKLERQLHALVRSRYALSLLRYQSPLRYQSLIYEDEPQNKLQNNMKVESYGKVGRAN
ncbi:unnamed protein product [Sphenostylis stenocarpa]|uniref:Uncharacterized protein n=1 Tax=Sphenostylis stenocarpa TaxID=92480 RepID=A0AA86W0R1_9FABA|nr:unnamed protein product [Sphenostylis stenocarpa]